MYKVLTLLFLFLTSSTFAQPGLGEVIGEVVDQNGEARYFVHVFIDDIFGQRYQAKTDFDGRFRISAVPPGEYMLSLRELDDTLSGIPVEVQAHGFYNCGLITFTIPYYDICICPPPIFWPEISLIDGHLPVVKMTAKDMYSPQRFEVNEILATNNFAVQTHEDEVPIIRGARSNDILYLIDNVKVLGHIRLPSAGLHEIKVYNGGIPAKYGDTTGGVVVIETKSYFDLLRERQARQL